MHLRSWGWVVLVMATLVGCRSETECPPAPPLVAGALATPDASAPVTEPSAVADSRTVVLVRHAEKEPSEGRDPPLSSAGLARAQCLADVLASANVTHLFATQFVRTRATLQPLADRLGVDVTQVAADQIAEQVRILRALPSGSVAVVAGHSNTIPALVRGLGGTMADTPELMWGDDEYDRMFVAVVGSTHSGSALELHYCVVRSAG